MPNETYFDKAEKQEPCRCKNPNSNGTICLNCGGDLEQVCIPDELKKSYTLKELLRLNFKREWLVEGWLHPGDTWLIKAQKKVGKSMLAQVFAQHCTVGDKFLGEYQVVKPLNVAFIFSEGSHREWALRSQRLGQLHGYDPDRLHFINADEWDITDPEGRVKLAEELVSRNTQFDILIWDCLYMFVAGGDINCGTTISTFYKYINKVRNMFSASNIVIHHDSEKVYTDNSGKKHSSASVNNAMGHSSILGFPTSYHTLMELTDDSGKKYFKLKKGRCRSGDIEVEVDMFIEGGGEDDDDQNSLGFTLHGEETNKSYMLMKKFLKDEGVTPCKGAHNKVKMPESTFHKHRKRLIKEGYVAKERIGEKMCYVWKGGVCNES